MTRLHWPVASTCWLSWRLTAVCRAILFPASPVVRMSSRHMQLAPNAKCAVCNDDASGFHYGVFSCEGCKVNTVNRRYMSSTPLTVTSHFYLYYQIINPVHLFEIHSIQFKIHLALLVLPSLPLTTIQSLFPSNHWNHWLVVQY